MVFEFFLDDQRGKELLDDCKAANIRFEYDKDGEKYYFGAENGEIIQLMHRRKAAASVSLRSIRFLPLIDVSINKEKLQNII